MKRKDFMIPHWWVWTILKYHLQRLLSEYQGVSMATCLFPKMHASINAYIHTTHTHTTYTHTLLQRFYIVGVNIFILYFHGLVSINGL